MSAKNHAGRWVIMILVYAALAIALIIWGFKLFGPSAPRITFPGVIAMGAGLGVLVIKLSLNAVRGKELKLHEQGLEVSLMAVGAAVPAAAAEAVRNRFACERMDTIRFDFLRYYDAVRRHCPNLRG
jgi:hypothetical protein